jgi:hypothetical protein
MKKKNAKARFPISLAFHEDIYNRIQKLREDGWKISEIFKAGIEIAEKKK